MEAIMEWVPVRLDWSEGGSTTVDVSRAGYESLVAEGIIGIADDGAVTAREDAVDDVMAYARHIVGQDTITVH